MNDHQHEHGHDPYDDGPNLHRMVFFSDAVFAIILTLLALELRPPELRPGSGLIEALWAMRGHFGAFALSFAVLSVFWLAHLSTMRRLTQFDWPVAIFNLILLFMLALMPFASALVGEFGTQSQAWPIYCGVLIAASAAQTALLWALVRDNGRLVGGNAPREVQYRTIRALSPGIAFGAGLVANLIGHPVLAAYCWWLFLPVMLIARLIYHPKATPKDAKVEA